MSIKCPSSRLCQIRRVQNSARQKAGHAKGTNGARRRSAVGRRANCRTALARAHHLRLGFGPRPSKTILLYLAPKSLDRPSQTQQHATPNRVATPRPTRFARMGQNLQIATLSVARRLPFNQSGRLARGAPRLTHQRRQIGLRHEKIVVASRESPQEIEPQEIVETQETLQVQIAASHVE